MAGGAGRCGACAGGRAAAAEEAATGLAVPGRAPSLPPAPGHAPPPGRAPSRGAGALWRRVRGAAPWDGPLRPPCRCAVHAGVPLPSPLCPFPTSLHFPPALSVGGLLACPNPSRFGTCGCVRVCARACVRVCVCVCSGATAPSPPLPHPNHPPPSAPPRRAPADPVGQSLTLLS